MHACIGAYGISRLRVQQQQKDGSSPVGGDDAARSSSSSDTEVDEEMSALPAGHKAVCTCTVKPFTGDHRSRDFQNVVTVYR